MLELVHLPLLALGQSLAIYYIQKLVDCCHGELMSYSSMDDIIIRSLEIDVHGRLAKFDHVSFLLAICKCPWLPPTMNCRPQKEEQFSVDGEMTVASKALVRARPG